MVKEKTKKRRGAAGRAVCIIIGILLASLLITGIIYRRAVRAVWCNLTSPKLKMDETAEWAGGDTYLHVPYAADSESQYLDLYVPRQAYADQEAGSGTGSLPKLYVIIHGGGFISNDSQSRQAQLMYRYFRDQGYACASINYRLAQEAPFPGALSDCKAAIRFLRTHAGTYGYSAEEIAVFGESAGGYLAVMCAVTDDTQFSDVRFIGEEAADPVSAKVDVLVDYYGHIDNESADADWRALGIPKLVRDIANAWVSGSVLQGYENVESFWIRKNISEMTEEEKTQYNPHAWIDRNQPKELEAWIIHGDADITVPYLHSVRLAEHLSGVLGDGHVVLNLVSGAGHAGEQMYNSETLGTLKAFLDEHLS